MVLQIMMNQASECAIVRASSSNDIPDKLHENKELLLADNGPSFKTLGLNWHPVSDCFHDLCVDNLESMKPIGEPQGTSNVIKPATISVVDFEAVPVVAEKIKKCGHVSHPDDKERGSSGSQDTWCIETPADAR